MESVSVVVGIELDNSQFNDKYIQGEIDKAVSGLKATVEKIEVGDAAKKIQRDLKNNSGKLVLSIDEIDGVKDKLKGFTDAVGKDLEGQINKNLSGLKIEAGDILDSKAIQKEIRDGAKNALVDIAKDSGIEISNKDISLKGIKKVGEKIHEDIKSGITNAEKPITADDIIDTKDLSSSTKRKVASSILNDKMSIFKELGKKYALDFSKEFLKDVSLNIEKLDDIKFNRAFSDKLFELNPDADFDLLGKFTKDLKVAKGEALELQKILNNMFKGNEQASKGDTDYLLDKIKKAQEVEVKVKRGSAKKLVNEVQKEVEENIKKEPVQVDVSDAIELKAANKVEDVGASAKEVAKVTEELTKVCNRVETVQNELASLDKQFKEFSKQLELNIENVNINISEESKSKIKNDLKKFSEGLSITIDKIELAIDIHNGLQQKVDAISDKLKVNLDGIEVDNEAIKGLDEVVKTLSKDMKKAFNAQINGIAKSLSNVLSKGVAFDFTKMEVKGLENALSRINESLSNGIQVKPLVDIGELSNLQTVVKDIKKDADELAKINFGNLRKLDETLKRVPKSQKKEETVPTVEAPKNEQEQQKFFDFEGKEVDAKEIGRLSNDFNVAAEEMENLSDTIFRLIDKYREYQDALKEAEVEYKRAHKAELDYIEYLEGYSDTTAYTNLIKNKKKLNAIIEEYNSLGVQLVDSGKVTGEKYDGTMAGLKYREYQDIAGLKPQVLEKQIALAKELTKDKRNVTNNINNNLYKNKKKATDIEAQMFEEYSSALDNLPEMASDKVDTIRGELIDIFNSGLFDLDFSSIDVRFEKDLHTAYEMIFEIARELQAEYNAKFKNMEGFEMADVFDIISKKPTADSTGNITDNIEKVENSLETVKDSARNIEFNSAISGSAELEKRLNEIKRSALEISNISYRLNADGSFKSALVTYKDEAGKVLTEFLGWEKVLTEDNKEIEIFATRLMNASETFAKLNKDVKSMSETLGKIKGNDLVDADRLAKTESAVQKLQSELKDLNTVDAVKQIELLNNEIEAISKVDKIMAKFDAALDIRKSMNLSIEGLEALRDRIQAIDGDTPANELRKIERAVGRIGSGNSNMIALESIIERATNNLEKFGDVAKGDSALAKLNDVVGTSNELMSQLSSGAIKSVSEVRNLRETVINTVRDLKNLENKKVQLEVQLKGLVDSKTVNKSLTNDIAKQISKMSTDDVNTRFTEISDNIKKLKDRASVIEKIDNAIKGVGKNVSELQKDNASLFDTGKLQKDLDNISGIKTTLEGLKKSLKKDEDVDLVNISRTLEQLDTAEVKLENNIDKLKQLNNLSDKKQQLRDDLKGLAGKIDDGEIAKLREEINKMTVDNVAKEFKDLKAIIGGFNKSEGQIVRLNRVISSLQDKVAELKGRVGIEWDSKNVEDEVKTTENAIKELIKTRSKLESGKSVNANTLTESINNANASYGKLDKSMVKVLDNKSKIEALQKEIAASIEIRSDLGLDTSELVKMESRVSELDATSKDTAKALENMKESVGKFGQSESQIVKINKTISDTEESVNKLMESLNKSKDSAAKFGGSFKMAEVNDDLEKTKSIIEELESLKAKLEAGGSASNVNLTSIINRLNTEYGNLKDTINEATKNTAEFVNLSEKLETSLQTRNTLGAGASYVEVLVKQLKEIDLTSNDAKVALSDLAKTISGLSTADTQIAKVQDTIAKINKEIEKTKQREPILSEKEAERVSMMEAEVTKLNSVLNKLATGAKYSSTEIQRFCNDGSRSMQGLANTAEAVSNEVGGVFSDLGRAINSGMQTALGFEFMDIFTDQLMQMKDAIVELDNEMTALKRVSNETAEGYDAISKQANQTAINMGKTTQEAIYATTAFVKMGYGIDEASESLSRAGLMLSNVAEMDIDSAVDAIVSTMKGMAYPAEEAAERAEQVVDVINQAGNKFALSSSDLAEGLRVGAASLSLAGNDLEQASSLIVAGTEVLQDSNKVSNGLRTISMRLRGIAEEGEELNPKMEELIKNLAGVEITDKQTGSFRSTYDIIKDIADVWETLGDSEQALLVEEIAGKNQANVLAAILQNAETLTDAYKELSKAAGSAEAEQAAYMDSIAGKANALKENFRGIFYDVIDTDAVKVMLDSSNSILEGYRNIASSMGDLPTLVATVTAAFTLFSSKGRELASTLGKNVVEGASLMSTSFANLKNSVSALDERLSAHSNELTEKIKKQKEAIVVNDLTNGSLNQQRLNLVKLVAQQAATTAGMVAMKVAAVALNAALSMGLSVAISGVVSLLGEMWVSSGRATERARELSDTIKSVNDARKDLAEFESINKQLESETLSEEKKLELNNQLAEVKTSLSAIDSEAGAILDSQNLSYERQLQLLESIQKEKLKESGEELDKAMTGGFFGKDQIEEAYEARAAIESTLSAYNELKDKISKSDSDFVWFRGAKLSIGEAEEKLRGFGDTIVESAGVIDTYNAKVEQIQSSGAETSRASVKLVDSVREQVDAFVESSQAASNSVSSYDDAALAMDGVKTSAEDATQSVKDLSSSFSSMNKPIELLRTMIEELNKTGGLSDETYMKVLESGDERLIAILADSENAIKNSNELLKSLVEERAGYAEELINTSYNNVNGGGVDLNVNTANLKKSVKEVENELGSIEEVASRTAAGITDAFNNIELGDASEGVKNAWNDIIDNSDELSNRLKTAMADYYDYVNSAAAESADIVMTYEEAKAQAATMWQSDEMANIAQMVYQNAQYYDEDVVNWANAVLAKETDGVEFSNSVLQTISDLIVYSGGMYGDDITNWAMALGSKDANQVAFVNAVMRTIAQMVVDNVGKYNTDTVNWANAVLNKQQNNANAVTAIGNTFSGLVNQLSVMYGNDATNFANATSSKLENLKAFQNAYNNVSSMNYKGVTGLINDRLSGNLVGMPSTNTKPVSSSIKPVKSSYKPVSSSSYVPNTGSSSGSGKGSGGKGSSSSAGKDVADLELVADRYYQVNNALKKVENELDKIDIALDGKSGKDRIPLLEKEIKLLKDKEVALKNVRAEQQEELAELKKALAGQGFTFAADGQITNYESKLNALVKAANSKTGEAKEKAIKAVKEVEEKIKTYTDLLLDKIPESNNAIAEIANSMADIREEIEQIIEDTTFFTKDFADRYYKLNNALKQVENQLNATGVAMENANDSRMIELLDKQIQLYTEQGKALAEIRKENVKELNELGKELYDAGFKFNADGTLANYESMIDKLVQNANKITDGKKQEKEIERIEELISTIEKYTDLLLSDIPDITNDMDDLANAVIDSQKEIADILAKQRDEYIENLEKETEALKKEIERRKELLQKQWEQEDAEDELAEKQKKLNELEDQLTVALRTGDGELIKNIREQIAAAQKEINDFIRDQEREYISDRFDEDLDKIDEDLENKIDEINEKLSDEELLNLVQSGVRDLTDVLNEIENGTRGVRSAFAAIGTTISETWINALDTFVDKLNSLSDINLGLNLESKLAKAIGGFEKVFNITQGNLVVQGNITEDVLPIVQNMIDTANNNLINDINMAFSR